VKVTILKYNAGNATSVFYALKRLGTTASITDDAEELSSADKVIFPGVGEASSAMRYLRARKLDEAVKSLRQPVLGICLGMQLMCSFSDENETACLGMFPYRVRRFESNQGLKVPHTGWNTIDSRATSRLFKGINGAPHMYFVHGYHVDAGEDATAVCEYGGGFAAAIEHENFYAVQFHPERSAAAGEKVLTNFLEI
jgi:imidazole glycerol-phosphate synthase subunit HisH